MAFMIKTQLVLFCFGLTLAFDGHEMIQVTQYNIYINIFCPDNNSVFVLFQIPELLILSLEYSLSFFIHFRDNHKVARLYGFLLTLGLYKAYDNIT